MLYILFWQVWNSFCTCFFACETS